MAQFKAEQQRKRKPRGGVLTAEPAQQQRKQQRGKPKPKKSK